MPPHSPAPSLPGLPQSPPTVFQSDSPREDWRACLPSFPEDPGSVLPTSSSAPEKELQGPSSSGPCGGHVSLCCLPLSPTQCSLSRIQSYC